MAVGLNLVVVISFRVCKTQSNDETLNSTFIQTQNKKKLFMKDTLMTYLNQFIVLLYQRQKNL